MGFIPEQLKNMPTVPQQEMSRLFRMQTHAAIAGIGLGAVWAIVFMAIYSHKTMPILKSITFAAVAAIGCLGCFVLSAVIAVMNSSEESRKSKPDSAYGWHLRLCSILTLLGMCILIIGSSGIKSPFLPLYIMTFTLTLENISPDASKFLFTLVYVLAAAFACLVARYFPIVSPDFFSGIGNDPFTVASIAVGLMMSLVVPAVSAHLVAKREKVGRN